MNMLYNDFLLSRQSQPFYHSTEPCGWYFFQDGFNDIEIQKIRKYADTLEFNEASLAEHQEVNEGIDHNYRKTSTAWIDIIEETTWIYEKMGDMVVEANNNMWKFDLLGSMELIQFARYYGSEDDKGNFYDWHADSGPSTNLRKISMIVQLTDEDEYEGGEVMMHESSTPQVFPRGKGTVICFPSYMSHKVTPVTKGIRESMVQWMSGPPLR